MIHRFCFFFFFLENTHQLDESGWERCVKHKKKMGLLWKKWSQPNPVWLTGYWVYRVNKGSVLRVCCKDNKTSFPQRTNASFRGKKNKKNSTSGAMLCCLSGISSPKSENAVIIYSPSMWMESKPKFRRPQNSFCSFTEKQRSAEKHKTAPQLVRHDQRLGKPWEIHLETEDLQLVRPPQMCYGL